MSSGVAASGHGVAKPVGRCSLCLKLDRQGACRKRDEDLDVETGLPDAIGTVKQNQSLVTLLVNCLAWSGAGDCLERKQVVGPACEESIAPPKRQEGCSEPEPWPLQAPQTTRNRAWQARQLAIAILRNSIYFASRNNVLYSSSLHTSFESITV